MRRGTNPFSDTGRLGRHGSRHTVPGQRVRARVVVVRVRIPSYVPLIGGIESRSLKTSVGLLDIPWFWVLVLFLILAAFLVCFFLVRTRGAVTLGAGVLFLVFAVVFFFGAWYKINAIIGDLMNLFTDIPFIGPSAQGVPHEDYEGRPCRELPARLLPVRSVGRDAGHRRRPEAFLRLGSEGAGRGASPGWWGLSVTRRKSRRAIRRGGGAPQERPCQPRPG